MPDTALLHEPRADAATEHFDVLIVGAGISGIGAAYHLTTQLPGKRFVVLESQAGFGGTWRTHRYPGIRSDSDLYTFGYRFKPWVGPPIATAHEILKYLGEVIEENGLAPHIRYEHAVHRAAWDGAATLWTLEATDGATGERRRFMRADLVADFVCRLLAEMDRRGARAVQVALRPEDHNMPLLPWIDPENFNPGYLMRGMHLLPRRGDKPEWQHNQDYWSEKDAFPAIDLRDAAFVYS